MPLKGKAVHIGLFIIVIALVGLTFAGCGPGKVVEEFKPQEVKVEPYTPEPEWDSKSDPFMTNVQTLKVGAGQAVGTGAGTAQTGTGTGTSTGTVPIGTPPTPSPGPQPGPGPTPTPSGRVWSPTDPVYGQVIERVEGGIIANALVTLNDKRDNIVDTYTTSGDGYYSFKGISSGYYYVTALATGYDPIPLSTRYFYFDGSTQQVINIEMIGYGTPLVKTEGGNFFYKEGDVIAKYEYVKSEQQTYWGALFDSTTGATSGYGYAYYRFFLPDQLANKYIYDGQWNTTEQWALDPNGVWATADQTSVVREYYNWYDWGTYWPAGWYLIPENGDVPFYAVKRETDANGVIGEIRVRATPSDTTLLLLTHEKYTYDYHKNASTAPVISEVRNYPSTPASPPGIPYDLASVRSLSTVFGLSECSYVTIDVYRESDSAYLVHQSQPAYNGVRRWSWNYLDDMNTGLPVNWSADTYRYYLQATDQAGNASATYGPYYVTLLDPDFSTSTKTGPATANTGDVVQYTIYANNTTAAPAYADIYDIIPTGTSYVVGSATLDGQTISPDPLYQLGSVYYLSQRILVPGLTSALFRFQVTIGASGTIINTADITDMLGVSTSASHTIGPPPPPFTPSTKTAPVNAAAGSTITYTIDLTHTSSSSQSVTVYDNIPANTTYVPGSVLLDGVGSSSVTYNAGLNRIEGSNIQVNASQTRTITFQVVIANPFVGTIDNSAEITSAGITIYRSASTSVP